jgi:hypothetical protein
MAVAEHIQLTRKLTLDANGGPNDSITLTLESGNPYRHYMAWVYVLSATPDLDVQPKFAGDNDGAVVNVSSKGPTVVFKVPMEEIRPSTRGIKAHPDDDAPPHILKSELVITNQDVTNPIEFSVYMLAMATPGGA